ncbi:hypothetical protein EGW08_012887 [Elysia chlorotica]|uniref:Uncharacterized protein n=1 Tax=Elysia chlorotica TaxID=188477 RepID=A0A433TCT6_ELYCH|nr:hypothetical protein EGW08_012887 [Elysia chlorotica]
MLVWTPPGHTRCLGVWPKKLQVTTTCLNTEKNPVIDMMKTTQKARSNQGFIRSHFYHRQSPVKYPKCNSLYSSNNTLEIFAPESRSRHTFLLIQFLSIDIAKDDILQVLGPSPDCQSSWSRDSTYVIRSGNLHKVSMFFSLGGSEQSGNGFEICFRWFTSTNESSATQEFEKTLERCRRYRTNSKDEPNLPVYDVIQDLITADVTGVVRSHHGYPWNYPRPRVAPPQCTQTTGGSHLRHNTRHAKVKAVHWRTFIHKLRAPPGLTKIRLSAGRVSLAGHDRLEVCGSNGSVYRIKEGKSYTIVSESVILNFSVEVCHLPTSHGFLLCYKWFSSDSVEDVEVDLCKLKSFALKVGCQKSRSNRGNNKKHKRRRRRRHGRARVKQTLPRECMP